MKKQVIFILIIAIGISVLFACDLFLDIMISQETNGIYNTTSRDGVARADIDKYPELSEVSLENIIYTMNFRDQFIFNISHNQENVTMVASLYAIDYDTINSQLFQSRNSDIFGETMDFSDETAVYISTNLENVTSMTLNQSTGYLHQWNFTDQDGEDNQIPISGMLELNNFEKFFHLFVDAESNIYRPQHYFDEIVIFGDLDFIYNTFIENASIPWGSYLYLNLIFPQENYMKSNTLSTVSALNNLLSNNVKVLYDEDYISYNHYYSALIEDLQKLLINYRSYQVIYWVASIPLIILTYLLLRNIIDYIGQRNQFLFGKLRSLGFSQEDIYKGLSLTLFIKAVMGMLLGIVIGTALTSILTNILWKVPVSTFGNLLDTGRGPFTAIPIMSLFKEFFIVIFLLFFTLSKRIKPLLLRDPASLMSNTNLGESSDVLTDENLKTRKRRLTPKQSLLFGIMPFALYLIVFLLQQFQSFLSADILAFLNLTSNLSGILALISPFMIVIALLQLTRGNKRKIIEILNKVSRKNNAYQKFVHRRLGRNWNSTQRVWEFVAITLIILYSFIVVANVAEQSRENTLFVDNPDSFFMIEFDTFEYANEINYEVIEQFQSNTQDLSLYSVMPISRGIQYWNHIFLNNGNWRYRVPPHDDWIENGDWNSVFDDFFQEGSQNILISASYAEENGIDLDEIVEIDYIDVDNQVVTTSLRVIGIFSNFFGLYCDVLLNLDNFPDLLIRYTRFYCETAENRLVNPTLQFTLTPLYNFFDDFTAFGELRIQISNSETSQMKLLGVLVNYVYIDMIFYGLLNILGYLLILGSKMRTNIREIVQIRIKGISERILCKAFYYENAIYIVLGIGLSCTGFLSWPLFLPSLRGLLNHTYTFKIPWLEFLFVMMAFFGLTAIVSCILISKLIQNINQQTMEKAVKQY